MKRVTISAAAIGLLVPSNAAVGTPDQVARLKSGDTSVCADKGILSTIAVIVHPAAYNKFVESGNRLPVLEAVSASGVNKDIGEVSCDAIFPPTGRIQFTVRPSLDEPGGLIIDISRTAESEMMGRWIAAHAVRKKDQR
jgi:hypothetical protein